MHAVFVCRRQKIKLGGGGNLGKDFYFNWARRIVTCVRGFAVICHLHPTLMAAAVAWTTHPLQTHAAHDVALKYYNGFFDSYGNVHVVGIGNGDKGTKFRLFDTATDHTLCHLTRWPDYVAVDSPLGTVRAGCIAEDRLLCECFPKHEAHLAEDPLFSNELVYSLSNNEARLVNIREHGGPWNWLMSENAYSTQSFTIYLSLVKSISTGDCFHHLLVKSTLTGLTRQAFLSAHLPEKPALCYETAFGKLMVPKVCRGRIDVYAFDDLDGPAVCSIPAPHPETIPRVLGWLYFGNVLVVQRTKCLGVFNALTGWHFLPTPSATIVSVCADPCEDRLAVVFCHCKNYTNRFQYVLLRGPMRRLSWACAVYRACLK